ncbi:hypothetical protein ANO11243_036860 [Dothideomycetidae sp. 11243]|nr:hypothetical protein ANO11243_036860 [fungal sp. No.11243]
MVADTHDDSKPEIELLALLNVVSSRPQEQETTIQATDAPDTQSLGPPPSTGSPSTLMAIPTLPSRRPSISEYLEVQLSDFECSSSSSTSVTPATSFGSTDMPLIPDDLITRLARIERVLEGYFPQDPPPPYPSQEEQVEVERTIMDTQVGNNTASVTRGSTRAAILARFRRLRRRRASSTTPP